MSSERPILSEPIPVGSTHHDVLQRFLRTRKPPPGRFPREVDEMLSIIHESLFEPQFSVKVLKARCRITDNNVSSRFRLKTGVPLKAYMQTLRMEAASKLLREHGSAIVDIATAVGFSYPQTFYRVFQQHYECTPAEYRRRATS